MDLISIQLKSCVNLPRPRYVISDSSIKVVRGHDSAHVVINIVGTNKVT